MCNDSNNKIINHLFKTGNIPVFFYNKTQDKTFKNLLRLIGVLITNRNFENKINYEIF